MTTPQKPAQNTSAQTQPWKPPQALVKLADRLEYTPAKLYKTLQESVFRPGPNDPPVSDMELNIGIALANTYNLNPLTKEIYLMRGKRGVQAVVGIDGWVKIVNSQPAFNGAQFINHFDENKKLEAITCRMHRKGCEFPTEVTELMSECARQTEPWQKMPSRMLRHKAYMQAARYAFGISGIYDEDEARDAVGAPAASASVSHPPTSTPHFDGPENIMEAEIEPSTPAQTTPAQTEPPEPKEPEPAKPASAPAVAQNAPATPSAAPNPSEGKSNTIAQIRGLLEQCDASEAQLLLYMQNNKLISGPMEALESAPHNKLLQVYTRWPAIKDAVMATEGV